MPARETPTRKGSEVHKLFEAEGRTARRSSCRSGWPSCVAGSSMHVATRSISALAYEAGFNDPVAQG
jgi:hypothetical protein